MRKQSGFTLIELMIVVAIIGVLTAVATLAYENFTAKTDRDIDCVQVLPEMARDQEKYKQINRIYANTFAKLNTVARVGITWAAIPVDATNTHTYTLTTANSDKTFLLTCTPTKTTGGFDASDCGALTYDNFGRKGGNDGTARSFSESFSSGKAVEICWR